jgi:hypothetical protein
MNAFLKTLRKLFRTTSRPAAPHGVHLRLDALEDRYVPSMTQITPPPSYPASAIVTVVSVFPDGTKIDSTGAMVDLDHVLTAGTAIYDPQYGGWATQIAAFGGTTSSTNYVASAYATLGRVEPAFYDTMNWNWATYHGFGETGAGIGDLGLLTLSNDMGSVTGHFDLGITTSTGANWTGQNLYTIGHPEPLTDGFEMFQQYGPINGAVNAGHYEGGAYNYGQIFPEGFFTPFEFGYFDFSQSNIQEKPVQGAGGPYGAQSGSPLFGYDFGQPLIYGVMSAANSSTGYAEQITGYVHNDLQSWMDADNKGTTGVSPSKAVPLPQAALQTQTTLQFSAPNPVSYGDQVTLTAHVSIPVAPCPPTSGTVTFYDGNTVLRTVQLAATSPTQDSASYTTPPLAVGSHSFTAVYSGSAVVSGIVFQTSASGADAVTVTKAATAPDLVSSTGSTTAGQPVTLTAYVPGTASYPTGTVTFYNGGTVLGTAQLTPLENNIASTSFTTSALGVGSHSITAVYSGDGNYQGSSSVVTVQITPAAVSQPPPPPPPPAPHLPVGVLLVTHRVGKHNELMAEVLFSDGSLLPDIAVPFQQPNYQRIAAALANVNAADGTFDLLFTAGHGKKTVSCVVPL